MIRASNHTSELARPHFEAVLTDIAELYGLAPLDLRNGIKRRMIHRKEIRTSTTELSEEELKRYANKMTAFYHRQLELEPVERTPIIL